MNPITENNKLRTEQFFFDFALPKSAVHFADLLISELNKNNQ